MKTWLVYLCVFLLAAIFVMFAVVVLTYPVRAGELASLRAALDARQTWEKAALLPAGAMTRTGIEPVALTKLQRIVAENQCTIVWHSRRHGNQYRIECKP